MRRILFYSDVCTVGGHELMALELIKALLRDTNYQIALAFAARNDRLRRTASEIAGLQTLELPFSAAKREYLFAPLLVQRKHALRSAISSFGPDVLISIQPRIEICALSAVVARALRIKALSYLPFAHQPDPEFEGVLKAKIRRNFLPYLYGLFDGFITITESARRDIRAQCRDANVAVVENAVRYVKPSNMSRDDARDHLGLPRDTIVLGIVGRIDFSQKGQDKALELFAQFRPTVDTHLLIVGSGEPDATELRVMVERLALSSVVVIKDWMDDVSSIFAAIDCLLLPSRLEGMPLVMLEAILSGVPVVGTDRDGMAEILPSSWRFERDDPASIRLAISSALAERESHTLRDLQVRVRTRFNLENLGARAFAGIESLL